MFFQKVSACFNNTSLLNNIKKLSLNKADLYQNTLNKPSTQKNQCGDINKHM